MAKLNSNSIFEGYWEDDQKRYGRQIFENKDIYIGEWKNNKPHGYGKRRYFAPGDKYADYEGNFEFGR